MTPDKKSPPLNLRLERSCIDNLLWRCDLPPEVDLDELADALRDAGCVRRGESSVLPLWVYFTPEEHRILIVPATRRVQLRVHYQTPKATRVEAATRVATLVCDACQPSTGARL